MDHLSWILYVCFSAKFIYFEIYLDAHNQKLYYWVELHTRVEILCIVEQVYYIL